MKLKALEDEVKEKDEKIKKLEEDKEKLEKKAEELKEDKEKAEEKIKKKKEKIKKLKDDLKQASEEAPKKSKEHAEALEAKDARIKELEAAAAAQAEQSKKGAAEVATLTAECDSLRSKLSAAEQATKDSDAEAENLRTQTAAIIRDLNENAVSSHAKYDDCIKVLEDCAEALTPPQGAAAAAVAEGDEKKEEKEKEKQHTSLVIPESSGDKAQELVANMLETEKRVYKILETSTKVYQFATTFQKEFMAQQDTFEKADEELNELRRRYFYALGLNIKQGKVNMALKATTRKKNPAKEYVLPEFHNLSELLDVIVREKVPIAQWGKWINDHILVDEKL